MMERRENVIVKKSESFADRIVKMCKYLSKKKSGDKNMLDQIYRSGTSIGANIHEGVQAQSKADFISKLGISLKEATETSYWLVVLNRANFLEEKLYLSLKADLDSIIRILVASIKTSKKNMA